MEGLSWFSVPSFVFLVVGAALGAAAGHFFSPAIGESKRLRSDLERLRSEHDSYRASVNSHFRKTADLVGQMTKSYAAVYDHLAGGARRFCDDAGADAAIPFGPLPGALASPDIETAASPELASSEPGEDLAAAAVAEDFAVQEPGTGDEISHHGDAGSGELAIGEDPSAYAAASDQDGERQPEESPTRA